MNLTPPIVTVFGGTGFFGRAVVALLARNGWIVRVATRRLENAESLRVCGPVGKVVPFEVDYNDDEDLRHALHGADAAVYSIGLLYEHGRRTFQKAHIDMPARIAGLCAETGVKSLVHISALACERGASHYAQSKLAGENIVRSLYPNAVILRPSVIFGAGDGFFSRFAEYFRYFPVFPLIGGGKTRFQPVFVEDVAKAVLASLTKPDTQGQIYELAGPDVMTMRETLEYIRHLTQRTTLLVPVPFWYAKMKAFFLGALPKPMLTMDQVESLKTDNVPSGALPGLDALGIDATPIEAIIPHTLNRFRAGGLYA